LTDGKQKHNVSADEEDEQVRVLAPLPYVDPWNMVYHLASLAEERMVMLLRACE
jgi:hypothetical protein